MGLANRHRESLLAPLALLLATGCAGTDGVGGESVDERADAVTENANDKIAFDFLLGQGLTPIQCAGVVGNLDQESSMDPTVYQYGGGPGRGIAQWSAGGRWDTSTNANVLWYAGQQGESEWSLNLQLEFIWWELTNEGYGYSDLIAATTVEDAVYVFQNQYEICGQCESANRIAHAYQALADFGDDAVTNWSATYESQSWPFASAPPIEMTQYQLQTGSIDLKNTGSTTWPAGVVKLAPIPRDEDSPFAASTWLSPTRVSTLEADVPPGGIGHFEWDLYPQEAGDFAPYFGLVAEGVSWFADSGGPPDNVMQVSVHVAPGEPPMTTSSGSSGAGGGAPPGTRRSSGSGAGSGADDALAAEDQGGCSVTAPRAPAPSGVAFATLALGWVVARRRRPVPRDRIRPTRRTGTPGGHPW